jgi:superfamily I DNA/RNA helicase
VLDLGGLNHAQLEAVTTADGPLLVLAGAGSGKTRVITYRLAHLIQRGVPASRILCVTFTNKAAHEMRVRARELVGRSLRGATLSTFHALGVRILRRYGDRVGLRPQFTITDAKDQMGSLRRILRALKIDDRRFDAKRIQTAISLAKNAGIDPATFRELDGVLPGTTDESAAHLLLDDEYRLAAMEAYERYSADLSAQNVVDFDDLLLHAVRLLRDPEIAAELGARWRYAMVDEYQDTNGAQLELVTRLVSTHGNVCVVGDDDQSIYGWRGADVDNILQFERHFPGARRVTLDVNYRSTQPILDAANAVIANNAQRHDKRLRAAAGSGDDVLVCAYEDEEKEAEAVAARILALQTEKTNLGDIAVLYRSNRQSRPLEMALRWAHIPYRVVGGMDMFDRKELKDALAYLRVLWNPEDEQSLRRVANWPPRGLGATTLRRVDDWARERELSLWEGLRRVDEVPDVSGRAADCVAAFTDLVARHRKLLPRRKATTVVKKLFEEAGIEGALMDSSDDGTVAARRVDLVRDLVRQLERYEDRWRAAHREGSADDDNEVASVVPELDADDDAADGAGALSAFLSDLMLTGFDGDAPKPEPEGRVVLSTIHAAKGLEWPVVFVVGCEEELLPHKRSLEGDGSIDEERRLAYVAITRARRQLQLSWARQRAKYGQLVPRQPSRFLAELPEIGVRRKDQQAETTEAEKEAIAATWRARIREQLGIEP